MIIKAVVGGSKKEFSERYIILRKFKKLQDKADGKEVKIPCSLKINEDNKIIVEEKDCYDFGHVIESECLKDDFTYLFTELKKGTPYNVYVYDIQVIECRLYINILIEI